ncbi:MAG: large subunit ribosomal protein [Chloroflexota bacterium]|nr:large subunit ribosomal protein [Chloroflexota bacterium]
MLYAIVESGGKQYKAVEGSYIEVDLLPDEVGKKKTFDKVMLLVDDDKVEIGTPYLSNVSVDTTVLEHFKGPKITVFKYRAKQRYRVKTGHRQKYTRVMVESIAFSGKSAKPAKTEEAAPVEEKAAKPAAKKTASSSAKKSTSSAAKKPAAKKSTAAKPAAKKTTAAKKSTTAKKPAEKK